MGEQTIRVRRVFVPFAPLLAVLVLSCAQKLEVREPVSFADAKRIAAAEGKPLLVDFFADW